MRTKAGGYRLGMRSTLFSVAGLLGSFFPVKIKLRTMVRCVAWCIFRPIEFVDRGRVFNLMLVSTKGMLVT